MLRPLLAVFRLGAAAACTDAGSNHAAQSSNHSEAPVVHGSAAAGDTVVAEPLIVSGTSLVLSGAAIQSSTTGQTPAPNGRPAL